MIIKHNNLKNTYNLKECKFLGEGHNGAVYMLPNGEAIKISYNDKDFICECQILEKVNGNKYFPVISEVGVDYMIRECVNGVLLSKYIKKNGLKKTLAIEIIDMLKEFDKLKFKKIDIRCRDIFVQQDGSLKIIDPQKCFSKERYFPRHLCKGLYRLGVLDYFLKILKEYDIILYKKWNKEIIFYVRCLVKKNRSNHFQGTLKDMI